MAEFEGFTAIHDRTKQYEIMTAHLSDKYRSIIRNTMGEVDRLLEERKSLQVFFHDVTDAEQSNQALRDLGIVGSMDINEPIKMEAVYPKRGKKKGYSGDTNEFPPGENTLRDNWGESHKNKLHALRTLVDYARRRGVEVDEKVLKCLGLSDQEGQ